MSFKHDDRHDDIENDRDDNNEHRKRKRARLLDTATTTERKKKSSSKSSTIITKLKTSKSTHHHRHGYHSLSFEDCIDALVLNILLSFLDVKSLFRFIFLNKHFLTVLTHEHVIRSALISGGHAKKTINEVINLAINEKTIFIPSPLRLLRLVNGKRCEFGVHCLHFSEEEDEDENNDNNNGETTKGTMKVAGVNHIRPGYGLFFCWDCLVLSTTKIKRKHKMLEYTKDNARVARTEYKSGAFVFKAPYTDPSGERAGPIITVEDYNNHDEEKDDNNNSNCTKSSRLKKKRKKDVTKKEEFLVIQPTTFTEEKAQDILKCLEQSNQDHENILQQKAMEKKNRLLKKIDKAKKLSKDLFNMLLSLETKVKKKNDDGVCCSSPSGDDDKQYYYYYDILCSFTEYKIFAASKQPSISFDCEYVNDLMKPYILAPSKMTQKKLKEIANNILQTVELIRSSGFLDLTFLNNDENNNNNWELSLKDHVLNQIKPGATLLLSKERIEEIQNGELFICLERWFAPPQKFWKARTITPLFHHTVFINNVIQKNYEDDCSNDNDNDNNDNNDRNEQQQSNFQRKLAKRLWFSETQKLVSLIPSTFIETCERCFERYQRLLPACVSFMDFIERKRKEKKILLPENSSNNIIEVILSRKYFRPNTLQLLEECAFDSILDNVININHEATLYTF